MNEDIQLGLDEAKDGMQAAIDHLMDEVSKIRAGKANPAMLDGVNVEAYGANNPINQVASVSTPDSRTIAIKPWDKGLMGDIEKAIMQANIGITPQNDGETIRLFLPPLTEERRRDLVKQIKQHGEQAKISIRSARKDGMDYMKGLQKDGLPEDMAKDAEDEVQKLTDAFTTKVDRIMDAKEEDLMKV